LLPGGRYAALQCHASPLPGNAPRSLLAGLRDFLNTFFSHLRNRVVNIHIAVASSVASEISGNSTSLE